ncbi:MAG: hypothetical protein E7530_00595 [Ruminococcaceae bacterium]|nr:hypothetical protein [Oscillospiraceae bacterium]
MFSFLLNKLAGTTVPTEIIEGVTEAEKAAELSFRTDNITEALLWFITGMVGIFMVIGIIILVVSLLNKLGSEKKKKD